jgi:2-keto-4-pentenoate hydratase
MTDPRVIADALIEAERRRTPIPPFTRTNPFLDVETAYKAQALFVEHRLESGERRIGAKLGLTSRVKRQTLGIHEPVYGRLTSGMTVPFGEPVSLERLIAPRVEPEIAFLIGRPIGPSPTVSDVLAATEAVFAAIEVVDTRYSTAFRLPDSIADNAGAARVVLSPQLRRPSELVDLRLLGCVFQSRSGLETAAGGAVMGHPAAALVWLAKALAVRGDVIEEGSIVLSGGLTASVPLRAQMLVTAEFDGLGTIGVRGS